MSTSWVVSRKPPLLVVSCLSFVLGISGGRMPLILDEPGGSLLPELPTTITNSTIIDSTTPTWSKSRRTKRNHPPSMILANWQGFRNHSNIKRLLVESRKKKGRTKHTLDRFDVCVIKQHFVWRKQKRWQLYNSSLWSVQSDIPLQMFLLLCLKVRLMWMWSKFLQANFSLSHLQPKESWNPGRRVEPLKAPKRRRKWLTQTYLVFFVVVFLASSNGRVTARILVSQSTDRLTGFFFVFFFTYFTGYQRKEQVRLV